MFITANRVIFAVKVSVITASGWESALERGIKFCGLGMFWDLGLVWPSV